MADQKLQAQNHDREKSQLEQKLKILQEKFDKLENDKRNNGENRRNVSQLLETSKRKKCLGAIDLMSAVSEVQGDKKLIHLIMNVSSGGGGDSKLITLQASNEKEAKKWVNALNGMLAEQHANGFK